MARLLVVTSLTLVAFFVALYTWNRAPRVECTVAGLESLAPVWENLSEKRPRQARVELEKLAERTRLASKPETYFKLIKAWIEERGAPDPRYCQRLQESIKRLW